MDDFKVGIFGIFLRVSLCCSFYLYLAPFFNIGIYMEMRDINVDLAKVRNIFSFQGIEKFDKQAILL